MSAYSPPSKEALLGKGRVTTLGMFIIDHFQVKDEAGNLVTTDDEVMGGGGIHAMTAARIFLPPSHVGLLVDKGIDFPEKFHDQLEMLGKEMIWFRPRDGKTTRAVNIYSGRVIGEGHQTFKYLSPQLHITPADYCLPPSPFTVPATPHPPEWMHVVCDTNRAKIIVAEAESIRAGSIGQGLGKGWNGKMVWEPLIRRIEPGTTSKYVELAKHFAIFSPNLLEMQTILEIEPTGENDISDVEHAAQQFRNLIVKSFTTSSDLSSTRANISIPAIVIRAGPMGSYTLSDTWSGWVPAYWRLGVKEDQEHVVDVTGGGNAFLGGLLAGLVIGNGDLRVASIYAATAASFAIEQHGLPRLTLPSNGEEEKWNGISPWERLNDLVGRVDALERK